MYEGKEAIDGWPMREGLSTKGNSLQVCFGIEDGSPNMGDYHKTVLQILPRGNGFCDR